MNWFSVKNRPSTRGRGAFSLLELLVSMAVVAIVMIIAFTLASDSAKVTTRTQASIENWGGLRLALDRIGSDLDAALKRADLPPSFGAQNGNSTMTLYAFVPGYDGDRRMAAIQYRITDRGLERGAKGLGFQPGELPPFSSPLPNFEDADFEVLASGVFRMAIGFYLSDGTYINTPPPAAWSDLRAVVVCRVSVNQDTLKKGGWTQKEALEALTPIFVDPGAGVQPRMAWEAVAKNEEEQLTGEDIPPPIVQGIEVRQRVFPLR